jgi:hypothetical protein
MLGTLWSLINDPVLVHGLILCSVVILTTMHTPLLQLVEDEAANTIMKSAREGRNIPTKLRSGG